MALPELRGEGRLLTDPRHGTTKTDKPWCSALVKFPAWRKVDDEWIEDDADVASVMAFDDNAQLLARFAKGDEVGVHGKARLAEWNGKPQFAVTLTRAPWVPERKARSARSNGSGRPTDHGHTGNVLRRARAAAQAERDQFKARRLSAERAVSVA